MKIRYFLMAAVVALMTACGTVSEVPLTGRTHRINTSDAQLPNLSSQEHTEFMALAKHSTDAKNIAMVQHIGHNPANAMKTYLHNNGYANEINNFEQEFNLVQDKQANAFCMPEGKVVVYEGLLPYTQNETDLTVALGHEIMHAVAKRSAEQITKQMSQRVGTNISGTILNSTAGNGVGDTTSQVAGGYSSFRNSEHSHDSESKANYMGFIFAAMAGYNPVNAVTSQQRMATATDNNRSEALSDHPSDVRRIESIEKQLPEAEKYYRGRGSDRVSSAGYSQSSGTLHIGGSSLSKRSNGCR